MPNPYYTKSADFVAHLLARGGDVNSELASIEAGFDRLPDLTALGASSIFTGVESGVADAYVVANVAGAPTTPTNLVHVSFIPLNSNLTDTPTLDFNGWGPRLLRGKDGSQLGAESIVENQVYTVAYNGSYFGLIGQDGVGGITPEQLLALIQELQQPTIPVDGFYWAEESGPWKNVAGGPQQVPALATVAAMTSLGFRRPFASEYS